MKKPDSIRGSWSFLESGEPSVPSLGDGTDIDSDTQVPVVVALALTDALLGCLAAVLSGRRDLFSWLRPGGT